MASYKKHCEFCGQYYDAYLERSRFCRDVCRVRANREKQSKQNKLIRDLLAEQTAAIEAGADPTVLLEIHRRATRLLAE